MNSAQCAISRLHFKLSLCSSALLCMHMKFFGLFTVQRQGLDVEVIECRWGDGADEQRLEEILKADKDKKIKAVAVVHNETTTGVTSDIPEVHVNCPEYASASL